MCLIEPQREQNQLARLALTLCRMQGKGLTMLPDIGNVSRRRPRRRLARQEVR
jgi:hypothetical protein